MRAGSWPGSGPSRRGSPRGPAALVCGRLPARCGPVRGSSAYSLCGWFCHRNAPGAGPSGKPWGRPDPWPARNEPHRLRGWQSTPPRCGHACSDRSGGSSAARRARGCGTRPCTGRGSRAGPGRRRRTGTGPGRAWPVAAPGTGQQAASSFGMQRVARVAEVAARSLPSGVNPGGEFITCQGGAATLRRPSRLSLKRRIVAGSTRSPAWSSK